MGPSITVVAGADAFGEDLKKKAVEYLKTKEGVQVQDLGTDSYHTIAAKVARAVNGTEPASQSQPGGGAAASDRGDSGGGTGEVRGLVVCGTGAGVSMVANKFPGVHAVTCDSPEAAKNARSINKCNVLALSGLHTTPDDSRGILDAWLSTAFKDPCPANKNQPWGEDILAFLDNHIPEIASFSAPQPSPPVAPVETCPVCVLASGRVFEDYPAMPGCSLSQVRGNPATAYVRFKAGSIEPAHHHSFSHDIVVLSGHKIVQNVSQSQSFELKAGDFLSTPRGDVHRVYYYKDTEFFIKWDGPMDIILDETLEEGKKIVAQTIKTE